MGPFMRLFACLPAACLPACAHDCSVFILLPVSLDCLHAAVYWDGDKQWYRGLVKFFNRRT